MYQQLDDDVHKVVELTGENIKSKNGLHKIHPHPANHDGFLIIYMNGCSPCINKAPKIKKLSNMFPKISFYALEGTTNYIGSSLINGGFPTIRYVLPNGQIDLSQAVHLDITDNRLVIKPQGNQSS